MLDNNERFQMNKLFPIIKKEYSETFGLNNKRLDDVEMTQFIKNQLESGQALLSPAEKIEKHKISTKLRQFKKPQLEAIIDELNRDDPSLSLKKGTIREMVDELDSKDIYDAPRFRSLLRIPDIEASVAPIMPVVPTPTRFSSRSLLAVDDDESFPPPPPRARTDGRPDMMSLLAGTPKKKKAAAVEDDEPPPPRARADGRPDMMSLLAGTPKKKGAPAAEPSDRVLRSTETKQLSMFDEIVTKKLKRQLE